ncbi:MAG: endonuclease/exonuclease/phosphatase family protein [Clostridia bacterium]|nr:endonuclease/exonuclease/phosphatase family protein [Clostridia bacterium]
MTTLKRFMISFMAFVSLFTANNAKRYADYCGDYDFPRIAAEEQQENTLRIMSFNIRSSDVNGTPLSKRIGVGVRQILEVMPDSVGIQEATAQWMNNLIPELSLLYGWVGIDRDKGGDPRVGGESCPVFYLKAKFKLLDSGNFWISDTPAEPSFGPGAACRRICTWAKLKNRSTGEIYVHVNSHFDHISEEARVQGGQIVSRFIEEHFSDVPVVFPADMNTDQRSETYATMTQSLIDARLTAVDCVTYGTFHGGQDPNLRADRYLDYVLCSADFDAAAYRTVTKGVDGRFSSDHFPIYADLISKAETDQPIQEETT